MFVDSETFRFASGAMAPKIVCTAFAVDDQPARLVLGAEPYRLALDAGAEIVGHNVAYDLGAACAAAPELLPQVFAAYRAGRVRDTMSREWLYVNARDRLPSRGFDLASTHARHSGRPARDKTDTWRLRYAELDGVPIEAWPEEARAYVFDDVNETRRVFQRQGDVGPDETRQAKAVWWLYLCSTWGITTDPVAVEALAVKLERRVSRLRRVLVARGLVRPDRVLKSGARKGQVEAGSRDMGAVKKLVESVYGGSTPRTDKGNVQTDDLTCSEARLQPGFDPADRNHRALAWYGKLGKSNATLTKDIPLLRLGQIHTQFGFAANGRVTSRNPNIQNTAQRGGVRPCFVARPGRTFVHADYGSLELCTLGQVCLDLFGRSRLAEDLNAGRSPLLAFAAMMLGISYGEAETRYKAKDPRVIAARQSAKIALYGFAGGLGAASLVGYALGKYGVRMTHAQCEELRAYWFRYLPEMRDYFDHAQELSKRGTMTQLRSGRVRASVGFTDAANGYFSGLGADIAKDAGFEISEACYALPSSPLYGWRMVNFVHDAYYLEGPPDGVAEAGPELSRIMVDTASRWLEGVTITAPWKTSDRWLEG